MYNTPASYPHIAQNTYLLQVALVLLPLYANTRQVINFACTQDHTVVVSDKFCNIPRCLNRLI